MDSLVNFPVCGWWGTQNLSIRKVKSLNHATPVLPILTISWHLCVAVAIGVADFHKLTCKFWSIWDFHSECLNTIMVTLKTPCPYSCCWTGIQHCLAWGVHWQWRVQPTRCLWRRAGYVGEGHWLINTGGFISMLPQKYVRMWKHSHCLGRVRKVARWGHQVINFLDVEFVATNK